VTVAEQCGENLTRLRERSGLSQEEVGIRADLHRTEISQLERGLRHARIDTVAKLAGTLGVEPGEFFEGIVWTPGEIQRGSFARATVPAQRAKSR
jgi:transcriptional regulator with XRE-family HTH domain